MSLWGRMTRPNEGEVRIPLDGIMASFDEWQEGVYNRQQVIDFWDITTAEEAHLDLLKAEYARAADKVVFKLVFTNCGYMAELDKDYQSSNSVLTRLQLVP